MLSKTEFKLAQDCPAKLYYKQQGFPTSADDDLQLFLAEQGYVVEALARLHYPDGVTIDEALKGAAAYAATLAALEPDQATIFEGTFISDGKLARADILVKDGDVLRLIEIKAKSSAGPPEFRKRGGGLASEWRPYLEDVTFQALVLQECFPAATIQPYLLLIDTSNPVDSDGLSLNIELVQQQLSPGFVRTSARIIGQHDALRRQPIFQLIDVQAEVAELWDSVASQAAVYSTSLATNTRLPAKLGSHCRQCEYRNDSDHSRSGFHQCWGAAANTTPHILELAHLNTLGPLLDTLIEQQTVSLFDVPVEQLTRKDGTVGPRAQRQRIQIEHTRADTPWYDQELTRQLARLEYPLHFLDFETVRPVLPSAAGLRPYGLEAFQWSCHQLAAPEAALQHHAWLNDAPGDPSERFASSLLEHIGDHGSICIWSSYELQVLKAISTQLRQQGRSRELSAAIDALMASKRWIDFCRLTEQHYFHPRMGGSISLKDVADAIWHSDGALRQAFADYGLNVDSASFYGALPPQIIDGEDYTVRNGTAAIRAYHMLRRNGLAPEIRKRYRQLLWQYCEHDTLALVLVWRHWWRLGHSFDSL